MIQQHIEREAKLDACPTATLPDLEGAIEGISVKNLPEARLRAVYFDTADLSLARQGITLRHRQDRLGGKSAERGWTLKLPAPSDGKGLVRKELSWPGGKRVIPHAALVLLRAFCLDEPLSPVAVLVTLRKRAVLEEPAGEALLEIDDDTVSVMDGSRIAARFREIEVEVLGPGGEAVLDPVLERLGRAGAVAGDSRPKVMRALGRRASEPPDVHAVDLGPSSTVAELVSASIAGGYTRLVEHDPGTRLDEDPEDLHQARVATRRLRSDLRTMRELLEHDWLFMVRTELGWLAQALGKVRDSDVLGQRIAQHLSQLESEDQPAASPLFRRLKAERTLARRELTGVMDSERYVNLLKMLAQAAKDPPLARPPKQRLSASTAERSWPSDLEDASGVHLDLGEEDGEEGTEEELEPPCNQEVPCGEQAAIEMIPRLVRSPWKRLSRTIAALGVEPTDAELHQVRIGAKRLRYACEAAVPVIGSQAKRLASEAAALQEVLGDHHDAVCAEQWLRDAARFSSRATAVVIGQLIATERAAQRSGREQWLERWKHLKAKKNRSWIEGSHR